MLFESSFFPVIRLMFISFLGEGQEKRRKKYPLCQYAIWSANFCNKITFNIHAFA